MENSPPIVAIYALDADHEEGDSGLTPYTFLVTRSGNVEEELTVEWERIFYGISLSSPGYTTTASDWKDNGESTGSVVFQPGEETKQITLFANGDSLAEGDEAFTIRLVSGFHMQIQAGAGAAEGVVRNDDIGELNVTQGYLVEDAVLSVGKSLFPVNSPAYGNVIPQTQTPGSYGNFSVDKYGTWTYEINNESIDIQSMSAFMGVSESFTVTPAGETPVEITVHIYGTNDPTVLSLPTPPTYVDTENDDLFDIATGTFTASDIDAHTTIRFFLLGDSYPTTTSTQTGSFGSLSLEAFTGKYTYTPFDDAIESAIAATVDSFTIVVTDNISYYASADFSISIIGNNDPALISGTTQGAVTEDGIISASGQIHLSGRDLGDSSIIATENTSSLYGTFSITNSGAWQYHLNNDLEIVQNLETDEILHELIYATVESGEKIPISITINGLSEPAILQPITPEGNKYIGNAADDYIASGKTNDKIFAGEGNNVVNAGEGRNKIFTGSGLDKITSGSGSDKIVDTGGNNIINAGDGNNSIKTGTGNDTISTGTGNGKIYDSGGNNTITTGNGKNKIVTGNGDDYIATGSGDDNIRAGGGNDKITTGDGNDKIRGEAGQDYFVFDSTTGVDRILDFDFQDDKLLLSRTTYSSLTSDNIVDHILIGDKATPLSQTDNLIFDTRSGKLYYDADGAGETPEILLAIIKGEVAGISADNFAYA